MAHKTVKRTETCGQAAARQDGMRPAPFYRARGILMWIAVLGVVWVAARAGQAQSSNPQPTAKAEPPPDTSAPEGDPASGAQLFQSVGCADCHGKDAEGAVGPPLVKIQKTFQQFEDFVRQPIGAMPNQFPPDLVSEDKLIDIYAFLEHPPGSPNAAKAEAAAGDSHPKADAENGKRLFTSHGCDKCHEPEPQGGAMRGQINAVPDSLPGLIDEVRHPKGQMPAYPVTAISDKELAEIYAYLKSRPKP